jgi:hypothetical protein
MAERLIDRRTFVKIAGGILTGAVGLDYALTMDQERQNAEQHNKNINGRPSETRRSVLLPRAKAFAGSVVTGYGAGQTSIEIFKLMGIIKK